MEVDGRGSTEEIVDVGSEERMWKPLKICLSLRRLDCDQAAEVGIVDEQGVLDA